MARANGDNFLLMKLSPKRLTAMKAHMRMTKSMDTENLFGNLVIVIRATTKMMRETVGV